MSDEQTESTMSQEDKDAFVFAAEGTLVDEIVKELADRDSSLITLPPKAHIHDGSYIITTFPGKYPTSQLVEILDETTKRYGTTTHNLFMRIGPNMLANLMLVKVENQDTDGITLDETLPGYCLSTLMENYDTVRIDINGIIYNCTQIDDNIEIPQDVLITSLKRMKAELEQIIGTKLDLDIDEALGVDADDDFNNNNKVDDDADEYVDAGIAVNKSTIEANDPTFKNIDDVRQFATQAVIKWFKCPDNNEPSEYATQVIKELTGFINDIIDYEHGTYKGVDVRACASAIDPASIEDTIGTITCVIGMSRSQNAKISRTKPTRHYGYMEFGNDNDEDNDQTNTD